MQLYGQISMFDQLTDYNDNDPDAEDTNYHHHRANVRRHEMGRGEDSCYDDDGEGDNDSKDLHEYRQRIEVINEDMQSFIMDAGEDGET